MCKGRWRSQGQTLLLHLQAAQGRILTTDTLSPLHRCSPASHSLKVWVATVAFSPTRTHTLNPGVEQSAESLQRHSLVWSETVVWRTLRWLDIANTIRYHGSFVTLDVPTVTGLPHVTVGAACCVALRPLAGAVFCYHVVLPHALQSKHFAHIQKGWFSAHRSRGTHLQRRTGDQKAKIIIKHNNHKNKKFNKICLICEMSHGHIGD